MREKRRVIGYVKRAMGMLLFGRRPAQKSRLELPSPVEQMGSEVEMTKALWRGAMVQMIAVNTATAWPIQRRREMRADAEARLDRYFARVERMIERDPSLERSSTRIASR